MGIQRLQPVSSGTDLTKITPFQIEASSTTSFTYPIQQICNIVGKGFLDTCAVALYMTNSNQRSGLIINVDGQVIYNVDMIATASVYRVYGLANEQALRSHDGNSFYSLSMNGLLVSSIMTRMGTTLPLISTNNNSDINNQLMRLSRPIYFKNSLTVTLVNSDGIKYGYTINGGLLA